MQKLVVIASYPPLGTTHDQAIVGGASYTKNTLVSMLKAAKESHQNLTITVLAEELPNSKGTYTDDGISVQRIWKKGSLTSYISLFQALKQTQAKDVLLTFEFSMFGGIFSLLPLPLFLLALKLSGKRLSTVLHQVITSAGSMSGHLNLDATGPKTSLYSLLFVFFYRILVGFSDTVIVFEEEFKNRLSRYGNSKIVVIPHGVESPPTINKQTARTKLGLPKNQKIVLCFGFLAWYKGTDWIVELFAQKKEELKDISLIIAGGPNNNHMGKPFYQKYVDDLEKKTKEAGILLTGFVREEDLPLYFAASDLTLLPYRTLMAASGPLSFAFSAGTPFLLSKALLPYTQTKDFTESLKEAKISPEEISFPLTEEAAEIIHQTLKLQSLDKLKTLTTLLREKRSWDKIGQAYVQILTHDEA